MLKYEARYGWDEEDQYYEYDPGELSQWELEGWVQDQRGDWVQSQVGENISIKKIFQQNISEKKIF